MSKVLERIKDKALLVTGILSVLVVILLIGAIHSIETGSGFLFIPSFSPTPTATPTATIAPVFTSTAVPTEIPTPEPTFDKTAFAEAFYLQVTQTSDYYWLMQTPLATPTIPDAELYTGLKMVNPADGKTLLFIKTENIRTQTGFWIDWNEISNDEYRICARLEFCSPPQSSVCSGVDYYDSPEYWNYPVVNITREQAASYCSWAGMELMSLRDWRDAVAVMRSDSENYDQIAHMPLENGMKASNILGNVWEWTSDNGNNGKALIAGGSWKTALQDVESGNTGESDPDKAFEDLGFRCVKRIQ